MIVALGLTICNRGNVPTFESTERQSIVDLTLVSSELATRITNWRVEDNHKARTNTWDLL